MSLSDAEIRERWGISEALQDRVQKARSAGVDQSAADTCHFLPTHGGGNLDGDQHEEWENGQGEANRRKGGSATRRAATREGETVDRLPLAQERESKQSHLQSSIRMWVRPLSRHELQQPRDKGRH